MEKLDEKYFGFVFHYYRAEVYRETNWRSRLDVTTNWAIVVTAAMLSFAFGNPQSSHAIILINYLLVLFFLHTESRRFRYYSMLRNRTREIEEKLLAPIMSSQPDEAQMDLKSVADSLRKPRVGMSRLESITWRLRRNYLLILPLLFVVWFSKVMGVGPFEGGLDMFSQAGLWIIPGWIVFLLFFGSVTGLILLSFVSPQSSVVDDLP